MQLNHKVQLCRVKLINLLPSASETLVPRNDLQTDKSQCIYYTQHLHRPMVVHGTVAMQINVHSRPGLTDNARNQHQVLGYDKYSLSNPYRFIGLSHPCSRLTSSLVPPLTPISKASVV